MRTLQTVDRLDSLKKSAVAALLEDDTASIDIQTRETVGNYIQVSSDDSLDRLFRQSVRFAVCLNRIAS